MSGASRRTAIIWATATLLMFPAFISGHIVADNSFLNVNWSQGFARELFAGHLYPRWLPGENEGAGSPVFYFYGPLPFYLTAPFELLFGPRFSVLLGMWLMLALSGQAFDALASNFVQSNSALISGVAYMAMPYHFLVDVWLRSDLGELGAYVFVPLCLLCAFRLGSKLHWTLGLAASFAGLLLSHLPSALLFAPFLVATCLHVAWREHYAVILSRALSASLLSLGLSAAYTIPALLLQDMIHASNWDRYRPSDNLLFTEPVRVLFELFLDAIVLEVAFVIAIFAIISVANHRWRVAVPWSIVAILLVFLVSPAAASVWNVLPAVFTRIQFPWRGLVLLDVTCCIFFALTLDAKLWGSRAVIRLMLYTILSSTALFLIARALDSTYSLTARPAYVDDMLIATHINPLEYLPSCRPMGTWNQSQRTPTEVAKSIMAKGVTPEKPIYYFPFLSGYVDGRVVPTKCDPITGFIVVAGNPDRVRIEPHILPLESDGDEITVLSAAFLLLATLVLEWGYLARLISKFWTAVRPSYKMG